mgnify:FL=1
MKIKCLICGDIIESKSVHNLVSCKCESCHIDGGNEYLRFGGKDFSKILIIFDDGTEVLAIDEENYKKNYEKSENNKYREIGNVSSNKRDRIED